MGWQNFNGAGYGVMGSGTDAGSGTQDQGKNWDLRDTETHTNEYLWPQGPRQGTSSSVSCLTTIELENSS